MFLISSFPFSSCIHAFFDLSFQFLGKFWGFCDFVKIFGLVFVELIPYDHALHFMLNNISCILGLCTWLNNVSVLGWIGFLPMMLFMFARYMFMHFHALHILIPSFLHLNVSVVLLFFSLSLSFNLLVMAPKKSVPSKNPIHHGSSFSFPLTLSSSVMTRHVLSSRRTFLTRWFIRNARSFCLTFQTLFYLVLLALGDELLFVRNPQGVLMCS